jgi:hypothetical protein
MRGDKDTPISFCFRLHLLEVVDVHLDKYLKEYVPLIVILLGSLEEGRIMKNYDKQIQFLGRH